MGGRPRKQFLNLVQFRKGTAQQLPQQQLQQQQQQQQVQPHRYLAPSTPPPTPFDAADYDYTGFEFDADDIFSSSRSEAISQHCAAAQSDAAVNSSSEMQQSAEVSIAASLSSLVDTFIANAAAVPACTLPADIQNSNSDFSSSSRSEAVISQHCAAAQSDAAVNSSTEMQQSAEVSIAASAIALLKKVSVITSAQETGKLFLVAEQISTAASAKDTRLLTKLVAGPDGSMQPGKLNPLESVNLARPDQLLPLWLADNTLEASDELGDLLRQLCYRHGFGKELIKFCTMARKTVKDPRIDTCMAWCYCKMNQCADLKKFLSASNDAQVLLVADLCFEQQLHKAASILIKHCRCECDFSKLANSWVRAKNYSEAVQAASKANCPRAWKDVLEACMVAKVFHLSDTCSFNLLGNDADAELVMSKYRHHGCYNRLFPLMVTATTTGLACGAVATALAAMYADTIHGGKLAELISRFKEHFTQDTVIQDCKIRCGFSKRNMCFIYKVAADRMMVDPAYWNHSVFKTHLDEIASPDVCYRGIAFYIALHDDLLDDLLLTVCRHVEYSRVLATAGIECTRIQRYVQQAQAQASNIETVSEALKFFKDARSAQTGKEAISVSALFPEGILGSKHCVTLLAAIRRGLSTRLPGCSATFSRTILKNLKELLDKSGSCVEYLRTSYPEDVQPGEDIAVFNYNDISHMMSRKGVPVILRTTGDDVLGFFKIDWFLYLVAVMLGPGYCGVPFGDKSTVPGFGAGGHEPAIRTTKKLAWMSYALPPPAYENGSYCKTTCFICLSSFIMDLNLKWFFAFNRKGVCWDRSTETARMGDLRLGLDEELDFMTVYALTEEKQQGMRDAYIGPNVLQGTAFTKQSKKRARPQ
jgi:hypothetical protein